MLHELPRPTDAELAILRVLWDRGPSTVREVHDALPREKPTGYTTVLKLLRRYSAQQSSHEKPCTPYPRSASW